MNILIHVSWHVKIHHQLDIDQVQSSTQYACTNHHFKLTVKQTLKIIYIVANEGTDNIIILTITDLNLLIFFIFITSFKNDYLEDPVALPLCLVRVNSYCI